MSKLRFHAFIGPAVWFKTIYAAYRRLHVHMQDHSRVLKASASFTSQKTMKMCYVAYRQKIPSPSFDFAFSSMSLLLLASSLLLHPQIKLIEGELMQLTRLEIKRRNLDAENLQVGVTAFCHCFLIPPADCYIIHFGCFHVVSPCQQYIIPHKEVNKPTDVKNVLNSRIVLSANISCVSHIRARVLYL